MLERGVKTYQHWLHTLQLPSHLGIDIGLLEASRPVPGWPLLPIRIRRALHQRRAAMAANFCGRRALIRAGYRGDSATRPKAETATSWPSGWIGSIAQCELGAIAIAAPAAADTWLGVDIRPWLDSHQSRWLAPLVADREELRQFGGACTELSRLHAAKEALLSALQPRFNSRLDYHHLRCISMDTDWLWFEIADALLQQHPRLSRLRVRFWQQAEVLVCVASQFQQLETASACGV